MNNSLSKTLSSTEYKAKYDAAARDLLVERIFLAVILKFCVKEYADCELEEIAALIEGDIEVGVTPVLRDMPPKITGSDTVDKTQDEGTYYFDIKFNAKLPQKKVEEIKKQIGGKATRENLDGDEQAENGSTAQEKADGEAVKKERTSHMVRHALGVIVNIEPHGRFAPGYPLATRMNFYLARMLSREYGTVFTGEEFEKLKKCYSIWILTDAPKNCANTVSVYEMTERHIIGVGENERVKDYALDPDTYQLMTGVMIRLGDVSETKSELLRIVGAILSNKIGVEEKREILREYDIPLTEEVERSVKGMGSLLDSFEERIREEERAKVTAEVTAKVTDEVTAEVTTKVTDEVTTKVTDEVTAKAKAEKERTFVDSIRSIMDSFGVTIEKAMDVLKIPQDERKTYAGLVAGIA